MDRKTMTLSWEHTVGTRPAIAVLASIVALTAVLAIVRSQAGAAPVAPSAGAYIQTAPVDLEANDLIYDPVREVLWASVPSSGGSRGNSVTSIGPDGTLGTSIFVGSDPNRLALSDNSRFLYVGLDGAGAVRRVNLETGVAGLQWSLGTGFCGRLLVQDMVVLAGNAQAVAISRRNNGCSPSHEGVAVYDNGVMRPETTPGHTGSNVIERSATADTLYGYDNESSEFGFRVMTIHADGITTRATIPNLIMGFSENIRYADGRIYGTTGETVDAATLTLAGTYAAHGAVVPDPIAERVYFVDVPYTFEGPRFRAFDMSTFLPLFDREVPVLAEDFGLARAFIGAGENRFGYVRGNGQVFLLSLYEGYEVSGRVVNRDGFGLMGVVVSDVAGHSGVTDGTGNYSFGAPAGSYTLTATFGDFTFDPPTRQVSLPPDTAGQDFVASPPTYTITGRIVDEAGRPAASVEVLASSGSPGVTGADGTYTLVGLEAGFYSVAPRWEGHRFEPEVRFLDLPPSATDVDFVAVRDEWYFYLPVIR